MNFSAPLPEGAGPEVMPGELINPAADILSFGIVLWEIVTGEECGSEPWREVR